MSLTGIGVSPTSLIQLPRRDFHRERPGLALGHLSLTLEAYYGALCSK